MPTYLPSSIRDELGALQFSNKSQDDLDALDWEQRSLDDIGRIAPARAFSTPDAPVYEAPGQIQLPGPRHPSQPERAPDWRPLNAQIAEQARQMNQQATGGQAMPGTDPTTMSDRSPAVAAPVAASGVPQAMPSGDMSDEAWARQEAARLGIDPQKAVDVGNTEGGFTQPGIQNRQGAPAYGPYQHYIGGPGNPGLGDEALAAGIDPRDPANSKRLITHALEHAARNGWGAFQGAAANGIGNWDGIGGRPESSPTAAAAPSAAGTLSAPAADSSRSAAGGWEVDQAALDDPDKWSLCGPVAAVMAATKRGGQWTVAQAKKIATESGLWNVNQGMGGLQTEVSLLQKLGVAAQTGAADLQHLTSDALAGNTPIISTVRHYFILKGYDPETGRFDTTTSGSVLKGGSRWLTLDQIEKLGGGIQGAAYIDNPSSPISSAVAGSSDAYKLSDTQTADDMGGPGAGDQKRDRLMAASGLAVDQPGPLQGQRTEGYYNPDTDESGTSGIGVRMPQYNVRITPDGDVQGGNGSAADEMRRQPLQATSGPDSTTGADPSSSYNDPTADGTLSQPLPSYTGDTSAGMGGGDVPPLPASSPADDPGGAQFAAQDAYSTPAQPQRYDPYGGSSDPVADATRAVQPDASPTSPTSPPGFPGLQAVYDVGGNFLHWIQGATTDVGNTVATEGIATPIGRGIANAVTRPLLGKPPIPDSGQPETSIDRAIVETGRSLGSNISAVQQGYQSGDPLQTGMGVLGVVGDLAPSTTLARQLNEMLPKADTPLGEIGAGDVVMTAALAHDAARLGYGAIKVGGRVASSIGRAISESVPAEHFSEWMSANAANVAAADARMAESGSTAAHGTLGVVTGNPLEANTAAGTRVIPPHVSDTLDFPVRVPTDPAVVRAIEAAGGSVDPNRGVNLNVIRMQGPEAAGKPATRSSTFYTAGKPGEASPYAGPAGAQTGGNERIEAPTTYRSPIVLKDPPGSNEGFDAGMRQLGVSDPEALNQARREANDIMFNLANLERTLGYRAPEVVEARAKLNAANDVVERLKASTFTAHDIDAAINEARRAGPPGSPERAQALKDLVTRYGGDTNVIDDLVALRGGDDSESAWAIKENILAHNARAKGYDGVLTIGPRPVPEADLVAHPAVQKAAADEQAAWQAMEAANRDAKDVTRRYQARGMFPKPDAPTAQDVATARARADEAHQAVQSAQTAHTDARNAARAELGDHHISELADFRESHNPTPGAPNSRIQDALSEYHAAREAADAIPFNRRRGKAWDELNARVTAARQTVEQARLTESPTQPPGYTLRSDIPRRGGQTTASATAGVVPQAGRGVGALNAVTQEAGRVVAGGVGGGTIGAGAPADTPEERRRNALIGAGVGMVAGPLASRAIRSEGGALATFGASPNYRPPTPAQIKAAEVQGARRGEMLNREVKPPGSSVPLGARLSTALTDPLAATRYAENLLTDTAGVPRLPDNTPLRASTLLRENPTGFIKDRIETELAAPVIEAAQKGLQTELPRYVEDTHQRDILDKFYGQAWQGVIDDRAQKIADAQARGVNPNVIARMQAKMQADAVQAGETAMRRRQGSNPEHTYEATNARLLEQEQRLTASGTFGDLQSLAQQIVDSARTTLDNSVAAGRVEPQVAADLKAMYPHYVPTVPISKLDPGGRSFGASSGGTTVGASKTNPIHALEDVGSSSERLNPIVAVRNQIVTQERQNHQNQVFQAFAQLMDNAGVPTPGTMGKKPNLWEGERQISGRINGQPETRMVPASVANGIESMTQAGMGPDAAVNVYKRVVGWFAGQLTAARASYIPLNLARDAGDTFFNTMVKNGGPARLPQVMGTWLDEASRAVADVAAAQATPRGIVGAAGGFAYGATQVDDQNAPISTRLLHGAEAAIPGAFLLGANKNVNVSSRAANEFIARGGASGGISSGWRTGQRWYRDVLRDGGAPIKNAQDMALFMRDWAGDVWNLQGLKGANERLDLVGRTTAMRVAESRGAGATEAMIAGRDSSYDPDKAGTILRAVNGMIPFTNATVQGGAQFARALRDHPGTTLATVAATLAPVMLGVEAWNRSDPQRAQIYDNVPQYLKDSGIVWVPPVEWGQGSDTRGSLPRYLWIPTEITTPFVVGMRGAMQHLDKVVPGLQPSAGRSDVNPDAPEWQKWLGVLNEAVQIFNPTHGDTAAAVASGAVPPVIKQTMELGLNKDLYRGNAIMSDPADERASALSQGISRTANDLGNTFNSPFLQNVRPSGVEHILRADPAHYDIASGISDQVKPSPYKAAEQGRIANEPFVGGIASRFVRDTGGANLERAQGQTLNQQVQAILQSARMRPSEADLTVPADYKGANLTRDEMVRWQQQANIEIQSGITDALDSKQWDDPMTRSQAVKDAISKAKERAAKDALGLTPRDIKDRIEQQSILQRQAVGAR